MPNNRKEKQIADDLAMFEDFHRDLLGNRMMINFLHSNGLIDKTIRNFKIGCLQQESETAGEVHHYLIVPYFSKGVVVGAKTKLVFRENSSGSYEDLSKTSEGFFKPFLGEQPVLFNQDSISKEPSDAFVCNDELDALTMIQDGFDDAVSIPGSGMFNPEWTDLLRNKFLMLFFGNDKTSQESAVDFIKKIGSHNAKNVLLPRRKAVKNISDFYNSFDYSVDKGFELLNLVFEGDSFVDGKKVEVEKGQTKEEKQLVKEEQERQAEHIEQTMLGREKQYLTADEVAKIIKFKNVGSVYNLVNSESIPFIKVGRNVRFIRTDIDNWAEGKQIQPADIRNTDEDGSQEISSGGSVKTKRTKVEIISDEIVAEVLRLKKQKN